MAHTVDSHLTSLDNNEERCREGEQKNSASERRCFHGVEDLPHDTQRAWRNLFPYKRKIPAPMGATRAFSENMSRILPRSLVLAKRRHR
jgi:hypothetical protein